MRRNSIVALIIGLALLVVGGALVLTRKPANNTGVTTPTPQITATDQTATEPANEDTEAMRTSDSENEASATITYDGNSFSPETVTIKAGETIEIKNTSSESMQFESDPHPVHTDNPELNINFIESGKSQKFSVSNTGTWGYHNHLDESQSGTIVVE